MYYLFIDLLVCLHCKSVCLHWKIRRFTAFLDSKIQLTQQRITDAGGREFRFRGDLYSQESTFFVVYYASSDLLVCLHWKKIPSLRRFWTVTSTPG